MIKINELDSGVTGEGKDITYVNGKYYMLSNTPAKVCVSEDLENWTEYSLNSSYLKPKSIAYGNGTFVISGDSGSTNDTYIYTSNDGVNWASQKINTGESFSITSNSCKFINNRFVLLLGIIWTYVDTGVKSATENWFYESSNGVNWKKHVLKINGSEDLDQMDIAYHNKTYVRVGDSGSIYTSNNLDNWTRRNSTVKDLLVGVTYGKGQFVVTGDNGTILTSKNGINWTKQDSGTKSYLIRSRYANGMYIVVGYNGVILQSLDAISWTNISNKNQGLRYGLVYSNERFVITATKYNSNGHIPIFYFDITRNISSDTNDSTVFFYNTNLEMLGIIDSFISLRWRRKYFEAGEFEIVLPVTEYVLNLIDENVIVMRNNYTEAGIIETIEYSDDGTNEQVTISGRFLSSVLERRIIKSTLNFSGQSIEGMNTIIDNMTPFTSQWETVPSQMSSKNIEFQATYKNVYDYMCRLSAYSNVGFRLVPNVESRVYMFEAWAGKDRTSEQNENEQYTFSEDNYNIEKGSLILSNKNNANYVLVGGEGEGSSRVISEVTTTKTGFDLYEKFSDQSSLSSEGLSTNQYKAQLKDVGESLVCEGVNTLELTATNSGFNDYKTKWDLGDIVNNEKKKWGQSSTQRIIEVEEVIEDGNKSIFPTFGSPLASAWKDD